MLKYKKLKEDKRTNRRILSFYKDKKTKVRFKQIDENRKERRNREGKNGGKLRKEEEKGERWNKKEWEETHIMLHPIN